MENIESIENIISFIRPELLVLIPALCFIGMGLKTAQTVDDRHIPLLLGCCGVLLAVLWTLATAPLTGWRDLLLAAFAALVQGVLCAGCSVYAHQLVKQAKKER